MGNRKFKNVEEFVNKKHDCHDFDDDLKRMEVMKVPENERPYFFYFVIGRIVDTNLK